MFALLVPLALFTMNCASGRPTVSEATTAQARCSLAHRTLTSDEITRLVVGSRVSYAPENRKCSHGIVIASPKWMDIKPDKTVSLRLDYTKRDGRYRIVNDRLCLIFPNIDRFVDGDALKTPGEETFCHSITVDAEGGHYMSGPYIGEDEPDPITVEVLAK